VKHIVWYGVLWLNNAELCVIDTGDKISEDLHFIEMLVVCLLMRPFA